MHEQHSTIPDNELLAYYYNDGNNRWLGILLQRYTLLLYGVCMKYLKNEEEAKDAVQQVFEKAINELAKYKVDYFKSWIYMVAKNHCLMKLRDKGKLPAELHDRYLSTPAEETDQKGAKVINEYEFNLADIDPYAVRQETQKDVILVSLTVRNKQKLVKVYKNDEVVGYDEQLKIRAKDVDNAREIAGGLASVLRYIFAS